MYLHVFVFRPHKYRIYHIWQTRTPTLLDYMHRCTFAILAPEPRQSEVSEVSERRGRETLIQRQSQYDPHGHRRSKSEREAEDTTRRPKRGDEAAHRKVIHAFAQSPTLKLGT
jgi:hypothetical protein